MFELGHFCTTKFEALISERIEALAEETSAPGPRFTRRLDDPARRLDDPARRLDDPPPSKPEGFSEKVDKISEQKSTVRQKI